MRRAAGRRPAGRPAARGADRAGGADVIRAARDVDVRVLVLEDHVALAEAKRWAARAGFAVGSSDWQACRGGLAGRVAGVQAATLIDLDRADRVGEVHDPARPLRRGMASGSCDAGLPGEDNMLAEDDATFTTPGPPALLPPSQAATCTATGGPGRHSGFGAAIPSWCHPSGNPLGISCSHSLTLALICGECACCLEKPFALRSK